MLGAMLGYDISMQCRRYCRSEKHAASHRIASLIFMPSVLSFTESGSSREARSGLAPYGRTPSRTTQK